MSTLAVDGPAGSVIRALTVTLMDCVSGNLGGETLAMRTRLCGLSDAGITEKSGSLVLLGHLGGVVGLLTRWYSQLSGPWLCEHT